MMSAKKSSTSSLATACLRCEAVTRFELRSLASCAALVTREIMKSSRALAIRKCLVSIFCKAKGICAKGSAKSVLTHSNRCHLSNLADILIGLHDALNARHRKLGLYFNPRTWRRRRHLFLHLRRSGGNWLHCDRLWDWLDYFGHGLNCFGHRFGDGGVIGLSKTA